MQTPDVLTVLRKWDESLHADYCRFTPFLGAGASSVTIATPTNPAGIDYWDRVSQKAGEVAQDLDKGENCFLQHVLSRRKLKTCTGFQGALPEKEMLVAILKLGASLLNLAGKYMSKERPAVYQLRNCELDFTKMRKDLRTIAHQLDNAIAATHTFNTLGLGALSEIRLSEQIETKLRYFACRIACDAKRQKIEVAAERRLCWNTETCKPRETCYHTKEEMISSKKGRLTIAEIDWFCDLVWHLLRYDVPVFPTTGELAFIVSLLLKDKDLPEVSCLDLSQVAEYASRASQEGEREVVDALEAIIESIGRRRGANDASLFHKKIGESIVRVYSKSIGRRWHALAVTTNYDALLEEAVEAQPKCNAYHILFPMWGRNEDKEPAIRWVFLTKKRRAKDTFRLVNSKTIKPDGDSAGETAWRPENVEGPIIVKLHGTLATEMQDESRELDPYIVLTEKNYLEVMLDKAQLWYVREQLGMPRDMWFFGYSLNDWNIRHLLFNQCKPTVPLATEDIAESGRCVHLVDRVDDAYKHALLKALKFDLLVADINELNQRLKEVAR